MQGKLYLCATPIGNLEDITLRVLRVLKEVDLIAAEDTRNSIHLLNHFDIHTPLTSYHEYNRIEKALQLAEKIKKGTNVALITDAGTPAVSDPGEDLVRICCEQGIEVTSLPGAVACVTALTLSGLSTRRFCFEAFLPREKKERQRILEELRTETRTIVLYEAPHHLISTLQELLKNLGDRKAALCRELTKKYETVLRMHISEILDYYSENPVRGECVIVLEGCSAKKLEEEKKKSWDSMPLEEHMAIYTDQGMDRKTAMKMTAKDRGLSKRDIYRMLLEGKEEE